MICFYCNEYLADLYHYYSIVSVIYTNLAMCYEETDQFKKAILLFEKAIQYALYCNRGNRLGFLLKGKAFTLERMTGKANKQAYQDSYQLMKLMCKRADQKRMQEFYFDRFHEQIE